MYDRILVPTDGSDVSEVAIEHAVDLAGKYDAEIHALYVVDVDAVSFGLGAEQVDRIRQGHLDEMDEVNEKANAATGAVADAATEHGIDVVEAVRVGQPHAAVADYAEEEDIGLVVIGSHGRSGVRRALLGSVTERVLRSTRKPVLVVDFEPEE